MKARKVWIRTNTVEYKKARCCYGTFRSPLTAYPESWSIYRLVSEADYRKLMNLKKAIYNSRIAVTDEVRDAIAKMEGGKHE